MNLAVSKTILNIAAILDYITGALVFLIGAIITVAGFIALYNPAAAQSMPVDPVLGEYTAVLIGSILLVFGIMTLIFGFIERRAVKDPAKIIPVWILSIILVVIKAGSIVWNIADQVPVSSMKSDFIGLGISILVLYVAANIKKETGR